MVAEKLATLTISISITYPVSSPSHIQTETSWEGREHEGRNLTHAHEIGNTWLLLMPML